MDGITDIGTCLVTYDPNDKRQFLTWPTADLRGTLNAVDQFGDLATSIHLAEGDMAVDLDALPEQEVRSMVARYERNGCPSLLDLVT